jgi:hypothetical protein
MPLSAKAQAERRARLKRLQDPRIFARKHCKNCNKLFPLTKPTREFCGDNCRKEFHANGGNAYGPLKTRLEKLVRGITRDLETQLDMLRSATAGEFGRLQERILTLEILRGWDEPSQSPSQPSPSQSTNAALGSQRRT